MEVRRDVCSTIICSLMLKIIKRPNLDEMHGIASVFSHDGGLTQVIGAIDGTHISIVKPQCEYHPDAYYNRKLTG